jgi:hypothetical protein
MARNAVDEECGYLRRHRYVLHDRDTKFCADFRKNPATGSVKCLQLPPRSPNLNAFAERWVHSVKSERLSISFCLVKARSPRFEKLLRALSTARGITRVGGTSCCFLSRLHRSVPEEAFDARSDWAGC